MNANRALLLTRVWAGRAGAALIAVLLCQTAVWGQGPADDILSTPSGTAWGRTPYNRHTDTATGSLPTPGKVLPHAGEYISTERNYYEIVYMPLQTRIYLYDNKFKAISAQDVHAQMTLQMPTEAAPRKVTFQFVPQPAGATEQDYVATAIDIRALEGKEESITVQLSDLKGAVSTETFTPYYPRFNIRPYIAKAGVTAADQDAITRQKTCPVTGVPLGSRGPVVKLFVAEFPLYLSGEDCIAAVAQAPQRFVPQAPPMPNPGH